MAGVTKEYTMEEVGQHNSEESLWIVVDNRVYDLTKFVAMHPGGRDPLIRVAGTDATKNFYALHRADVLTKYARLAIGRVVGTKTVIRRQPGDISTVPYAESSGFMGMMSPYYKESHHQLKKELRHFVDTNLALKAPQMDTAGKAPTKEMFLAMGKAGILAARIGPGQHLSMPGVAIPASVTASEFDYFHEMIAHEEMANLGTPGFNDGAGGGMTIGLPPVVVFGKPALQAKVVPEVLSGSKRICLAISDPDAGSDVANIGATAKKTADGKHYIVNGVKKWITGGCQSDYFTTAVRTGGAGVPGISLLLIERGEGVETKLIKTSYSPAAGTAYVTFDNVKVPVENLLGEEHQGFKCIMYNFNHERWLIIVGIIRATRKVTEECFKWAHQRKVFGKPLIQQPVIREKLGRMFARNEAVQNWMENITYQMTQMTYDEQSKKLAGPLALLKYQCTRVAYDVSDDACQIFGGRAITQSGMGQVIERFQRSIKYGAILGGSEEIMADLGVRMAMKSYPRNAKL